MNAFRWLSYLFGIKQTPKQEWMTWVGDGMAADGKQQIGRPVNIYGRTGRVVDATDLMILVEWSGRK